MTNVISKIHGTVSVLEAVSGELRDLWAPAKQK
jgi:hypothetical protein